MAAPQLTYDVTYPSGFPAGIIIALVLSTYAQPLVKCYKLLFNGIKIMYSSHCIMNKNVHLTIWSVFS